MVEKFCLFLTNRMRKENQEIDDERAEIINYGLQLLVGEIPKMLITIGIAYLLGILKLTIIMVILILPFRAFSGGFTQPRESNFRIMCLDIWHHNNKSLCTSRYRECSNIAQKRKKTEKNLVLYYFYIRINTSFSY